MVRTLREVLQIAASTQGPLVGQKVVQRNEMHRNTKETASDPLFPRVGEIHGRDLGKNIDAHGSDANLIDELLPSKGFGIDPVMIQRSPEFFERFDDSE